jgi:hypothetical protein
MSAAEDKSLKPERIRIPGDCLCLVDPQSGKTYRVTPNETNVIHLHLNTKPSSNTSLSDEIDFSEIPPERVLNDGAARCTVRHLICPVWCNVSL